MSVTGSAQLQAFPEADLPPEALSALVQYLRDNPVLASVCKRARIASKLQDPAGMPEPAITLLMQGGLGRDPFVPAGWHNIDLWCYGTSGYLAHKLLRIVERVLLPPAGPVGFIKNGCRVNEITWPGERGGRMRDEEGGWEFYFVPLQVHATLVPIDAPDTPPITFGGI